MLTISGENVAKDVHAGLSVKWPFKVSTDASNVTLVFTITTGPDASSAPEWSVLLNDTSDEIWSNYKSKGKDKGKENELKLGDFKKGQKDLVLEVICPKGARYGDTVSVSVTANGAGESTSTLFSARATQSIVVLKTQMDQEKTVADSLAARANDGEKDIYAILSPATLRGYVFVEGMNTDRMHDKAKGIKKARSFVEGETSIAEIDHYLTPLSTVVGIVEGDIIELINGPFKGEKARVQQIDQTKEEITVELIEAMVPIPVTVKGDSVRVIEKEK